LAFAGAYIAILFSSALLQKIFGVYALALTIPMVLTSKNRLKNSGGEVKVSQPFTSSKVFLVYYLESYQESWGSFGTSGTATIVAGLYILGLPVTVIIGHQYW